MLQVRLTAATLLRGPDQRRRLPRRGTEIERLPRSTRPDPEPSDLPEKSDRVVEILNELVWDTIWDATTDTERRTLLDEYGSTLQTVRRGTTHPERAEPPRPSALLGADSDRVGVELGVGGGLELRNGECPWLSVGVRS